MPATLPKACAGGCDDGPSGIRQRGSEGRSRWRRRSRRGACPARRGARARHGRARREPRGPRGGWSRPTSRSWPRPIPTPARCRWCRCAGRSVEVGDIGERFSIQSVSKPFVLALACDALGADLTRERLGANATGMPFNSVMAVELNDQRTMNPMVNAGAIAATSLLVEPGGERRGRVGAACGDGLSRFAGRDLVVDEEVYDVRDGAPTCATTASPTCCTATGGCSVTPTWRPTSTPDSARSRSTPTTSPSWPPRWPTAESTRSRASGWSARRRAPRCSRSWPRPGSTSASGDWLWDIGLPGQEWRQRRDRHGLTGQGWARHVVTTARRRGQQRAGAADHPSAVDRPGAQHLRVSRGRGVTRSCGPRRRRDRPRVLRRQAQEALADRRLRLLRGGRGRRGHAAPGGAGVGRRAAGASRAAGRVRAPAPTTQVLGHPVAAPVLVAPTAALRLVDPAGEVGVRLWPHRRQAASWCCRCGRARPSRRWVPVGPFWQQLYVLRDRGSPTR